MVEDNHRRKIVMVSIVLQHQLKCNITLTHACSLRVIKKIANQKGVAIINTRECQAILITCKLHEQRSKFNVTFEWYCSVYAF